MPGVSKTEEEENNETMQKRCEDFCGLDQLCLSVYFVFYYALIWPGLFGAYSFLLRSS